MERSNKRRGRRMPGCFPCGVAAIIESSSPPEVGEPAIITTSTSSQTAVSKKDVETWTEVKGEGAHDRPEHHHAGTQTAAAAAAVAPPVVSMCDASVDTSELLSPPSPPLPPRQAIPAVVAAALLPVEVVEEDKKQRHDAGGESGPVGDHKILAPGGGGAARFLSAYYPHGDTRLRVDGDFPNQSEIRAKIEAFVEGNMIEWLECRGGEGGDDAAVMAEASRALLEATIWAFHSRYESLIRSMYDVFGLGSSSGGRRVLSTLCEHTAGEMIRQGWERCFYLHDEQREDFRDHVLEPVRSRMTKGGLLSSYAESDMLEVVALDSLWIVAACRLSGPPFDLKVIGEEEGSVLVFDRTRHRLLDGDVRKVRRVRVVFPSIQDLLPQSICLADDEDGRAVGQ